MCNFCHVGWSTFKQVLLFYVGPPPDEGEDDHDSGDGEEESKVAKRKVLPRKRTKGNSFLCDI